MKTESKLDEMLRELEVLEKMENLLAREENWTQHSLARMADGTACGLADEKAHSYCLIGAHSLARKGYNGLWKHYDALQEVTNSDPVMFNNTHTHAEVMEKLREAKKLLIESY